MRPSHLSAFVLALIAWLPAGAATIVVNPAAPGAGDGNPGTDARPLATIGAAADRAEPGDVVRIHAGVYRETVTIAKSGTADRPIRFEAAPGATVVVTGAEVVRDWRREPGDEAVYSAPWPHKFITWNTSHTHPDDDAHALVGRSEQVFVLGMPLSQVLRREALTRGTFFVDLDAGRLHACPRDGANLTKAENRVEASARPVLWEAKGAHLHVRGLRFRYAANMAQHGAAVFSGAHGVVEDCVFERTNSSGATFAAPDLTVRRCRFLENGQLGFGAQRAHRLHLIDCEVRGNNAKGFSRGWEAGGDKLVLCRGVVIESSRFVENRGNGLWFDIGNEDCTVRNCLIADNEDAGIFYEISYGLRAHDNVIIGNGLADTPGSWGAGAGIALSSSPGCTIERNLLLGNREGIAFREQIRTTPRIEGGEDEEPVWNHDQVVRHNLIAFNRDAQTWGWFDVPDDRAWPKAEDAGATAPSGLSLGALRLALEGNVYAAHPGQGLFRWGAPWRRHQAFDDLEGVRSALGLERGSVVAEVPFAEPAARDFRLPPGNVALERDAYPRGSVPGVTLGPITDAGR